MRIVVATLLAFIIALPSCVSARDINPSKLQRSATHEEFRLPSEFSSATTVARSSVEYVLLPGTYVRTFESSDGFYLVGSEASLQVRVSTPRSGNTPLLEMIPRRGVIFVPNDSSLGATLMFFLPDGPQPQIQPNSGAEITALPDQRTSTLVGAGVVTSIINAMLAARAGKITIPKGSSPNNALRTLLIPAHVP